MINYSFLFFLICSIVGIFVGDKVVRKEICEDSMVIGNKPGFYNWFYPVTLLFLCIFAAILFEIGINDYIMNLRGLFLLKICVNGGVFIPLLCFLLSLLFGFIIRLAEIDWHPFYGENTAKIFFTAAIVINSLFYVYIGYSTDHVQQEIKQALFERIIIWIITAGSIWMPIAAGCKGLREQKDKDVLKKNNINLSCFKEFARFYAPIVAWLFILTILYFIIIYALVELKTDLIRSRGVLFFLCGAVTCIVTIIFETNSKYPSEKVSNRKLRCALERRSNETYRYRHLKYQVAKFKLGKEYNTLILVLPYNIECYIYTNKDTHCYKTIDKSFLLDTAYFSNNDELYENVKRHLKNIEEKRNKGIKSIQKQYKEHLQKEMGMLKKNAEQQPNERKAWFIIWNEDKRSWNDYSECCEKTKRGQPCVKTWIWMSKKPQIGDEVFLLKLGAQPRGLIGHGTVSGEVCEAEPYDPDKLEEGKLVDYIEVTFDRLVDYQKDEIVSQNDLNAKCDEQQWSPMLGIEIKNEVLSTIHEMWSAAVSTNDRIL